MSVLTLLRRLDWLLGRIAWRELWMGIALGEAVMLAVILLWAALRQ